MIKTEEIKLKTQFTPCIHFLPQIHGLNLQ